MDSRLHYHHIHYFFLSIILLFCNVSSFGQCGPFNGINGFPWALNDRDTFEIKIEVEDLNNNDLAGVQGICGVQLNFNHEQVSDLTILLLSPSNDTVTLIGPGVPNGTMFVPFFGIDHDILFVPDSSQVMPDPGFQDRWTNQNPNWGIQPSLTGIYYPHFGDLETSFEGDVNGEWRFVIADNFFTGEGVLNSVELIFCDTTNISCSICEAHIDGYADSIAICEGEGLEESQWTTTTNTPDQEYTTLYILDNGVDIEFIDVNFAFESLAVGEYEITAISVFNDDLSLIQDDISIGQIRPSSLSQDYCFDISEPSLALTVGLPDTTQIVQTFCPDDVPFDFDGVLISNTDTTIYRIVDDCGNTEEVIFEPTMISAQFTQDTFIMTCNDADFIQTLDASTSVLSSGSDVIWIRNGFLISGENGLTHDASLFGEYIIRINDGTCVSSDTARLVFEADVKEYDFDHPDAFSCGDTIVQIEFSNRGTVFSSNWSGPGIIGDDSNTDSIMVDLPGTYRVTGLDNVGCPYDETIEIGIDTTSTDYEIVSDTLSCGVTNATVQFLTSDTDVEVRWTQGGNVVDNSLNFTTSSSDSIFIEIVSSNGCTENQVFLVPSDTGFVSLAGDTALISCTASSVDIGVEVQIGVNYQWLQNDVVISDQSRITVSDPGDFILIGVGSNNCSDTAFYQVGIDTILPLISTMTDGDITCLKDSSILEIEVIDGASIEWQFPDVENDSAMTQVVYEPGSYTVEVINEESGCRSEFIFDVLSNTEEPVFEIVKSDISCTNSIGTYTVVTDSENIVSLALNGNPPVIITNQLQVDQPSAIQYIVTAPNGCVVEGFDSIVSNITLPEFEVPNSLILDCNSNSVSFVPMISLDSIFEYYFIESDGNILRADSISFSEPGFFDLVVIGVDSCQRTERIEVLPNIFNDSFDLGLDSGVFCDSSFTVVDMSFVTANDDLSAQWTPSGAASIFDSGSEVILSGQGTFTLELTDERNECVASFSYDLSFTDEPLQPLIVTHIDESCQGFSDGSLLIEPIGGGQGMLFVEINGELEEDLIIESLSPGEYTVSVMDDLRCKVDTVIQIQDGSLINFELGPDITLLPREQIELNPTILLGESTLSSTMWFYNDSLLSSDSELLFSPTNDGVLVLEAINSDGCIHVDSLLVSRAVALDDLFYLPNAIALNSVSGNNFLIGSFSSTISTITSFTLYDRWGNQMTQLTDFLPGENLLIWDGTHKGQQVNPGVYIYKLEVVLNNGVTERSAGDITVFN